MIYDYKDFDLTKTAYNLTKKANYPYKFYYISFTDMEHTYRTNPIAPAIVEDESLFCNCWVIFCCIHGERC